MGERETNSLDGNWSKSITNIYSQSTGICDDEYVLLKQQGYIDIKK